jgi:hypothetical protein
MTGTVTVKKYGKRFKMSFSKLPDRVFGPYDFAETIRDLRVSALLSPVDARSLVIDATVNGAATTQCEA